MTDVLKSKITQAFYDAIVESRKHFHLEIGMSMEEERFRELHKKILKILDGKKK